jgi:hypothetical protein
LFDLKNDEMIMVDPITDKMAGIFCKTTRHICADFGRIMVCAHNGMDFVFTIGT